MTNCNLILRTSIIVFGRRFSLPVLFALMALHFSEATTNMDYFPPSPVPGDYRRNHLCLTSFPILNYALALANQAIKIFLMVHTVQRSNSLPPPSPTMATFHCLA